MEERKPRTITCKKCGKTETEKVFGTGFSGWIQICELTYTDDITKKIRSPELCPECVNLLKKYLDNEI
jgi:hypothetical protein